MSEQLLPCPFCGINNEEIKNKTEYLYHDTWEISCGGCGAALSIRDYNKDTTYYESDIIAAWNRRFVCHDKNGDKVFAGDRVKHNTTIGKAGISGKIIHVYADDGFMFSFPANEIELIKLTE